MKKQIKGVLAVMTSVILTGCSPSEYVIGENPSLEEITSVRVSGGGMDRTESWHWRASSSRDVFKLEKGWWDENDDAAKEQTVEISSYDYQKIVQSLENVKYVKYKPDSSVMDGGSQSADISWMNKPSGSWRIDFGENGMRDLLLAMNEAWSANSWKANESAGVSGILSFTFSYGPDSIAYGDNRYTAELDRESGMVNLTFKNSGEPYEDARTCVADASFMEELADIIEACGADRWDGFSGTDSYVMDGSSFGFEVIMESGNKIHARGTQKWPDGFASFHEAVSSLFAGYFE